MKNLDKYFDNLRVLRAISIEGSFKDAALSLEVSKSFVTKKVSELEIQYGMPVANRSSGGNSTSLTEFGQQLVDRTQIAIDALVGLSLIHI